MKSGAVVKKVFGDWGRLYTRHFFAWTGARIFYFFVFFLFACVLLILFALPLFALIQSE